MPSHHPWSWFAPLVGVAVAFLPASAQAFRYGTAASDPCHEDLAAAALRQTRIELPNVLPLPLSSEDKAFADDLQFDLPTDMYDTAGATLLAAVRDNDLKGKSPLDIEQLAAVHGAPELQAEHCLRNPEHDEPDGTLLALQGCRQFIKTRVLEALEGLDAAGNVDPANRIALPVDLSVRGPVDVKLPRFYVMMGRALHALQDGFAHTWRTSDRMRVTVVLNWIDETEDRRVEERDGPPHASELDRCDDPDETRRMNRELATRASVDMLRVALDPALSREQKDPEIDVVLDRYLSHEPGCTAANGWCDAPERAYADSEQGCLCRAAGRARNGGTSALLGLLVFAAAVARRSGKRRSHRSHALLVASLVALIGLAAGPASAQTPEAAGSATEPADEGSATDPEGRGVVEESSPGAATPPSTPATENAPGERVVSVADGQSPVLIVPKDDARLESGSKVGGYLFGGASYDNAAVAVGGGFRYRFSSNWLAGLDGEWNPFFQTHRKNFTVGAANAYFTLIRRWPMRYERVALRSTLNLGASYLLYDLVGAPAGSIGPYIGITFLGVEWKASRDLYLIFEPTSIALPIPQVSGAYFGYPQYRFTVGLQLGG